MVPLRVGTWHAVLPVFGEYPAEQAVSEELQRKHREQQTLVFINILFGVNEILLLGNK